MLRRLEEDTRIHILKMYFYLIPELNPSVQAYLDEHLLRAFSHRQTVNVKTSSLKPRQLRRRMSCKGAIKKTRSINVDGRLTHNFWNISLVTNPSFILRQLIISAWKAHWSRGVSPAPFRHLGWRPNSSPTPTFSWHRTRHRPPGQQSPAVRRRCRTPARWKKVTI